MPSEQARPGENDAVLGGQNLIPRDAAVLGGIEGVKSRLASPDVEARIAALSEAPKYGDPGLDLIIGALQDESVEVRIAALSEAPKYGDAGLDLIIGALQDESVEVRIAALSEAPKYEDAGLDLILRALRDESMQVKLAAYSLLKDRNEVKIKQHLQNYFFTLFDVITVDSYGQESSRRKSLAFYFPEDLGNGIVLSMVYIPGGTFMMGSPATESGRDSRESPQHQVTISAFYAGKYPITQAEWQAVMGNNPSEFKGEKRPVECVSWDDAVEFCSKLSEKTGNKYRLLSEAEWEYACRAGTTTPFHFGETITPDLVNYDGNKPYANAPTGVYRRQTTDVGSFPPNAFGLYDIHGNVWEWCSDRWHDNYNGAPTDGSSWETGTYNKRVQRGGSWVINAVYCRSADRVSYSADGWWKYRGFRVAVTSVSAPS